MMAEATSSSAQCSPPGGEIKTEDKDPFKSTGSLVFRIDNFREFSNGPPEEASKLHCDDKVSVRGLTFGLAVFPTPKWLPTQEGMCMGVIVKCENASGCNMEGDGSWSCMTAMTMRIKSLLKSGVDETRQFVHWFFSDEEESSLIWEDGEPWNFDNLMDPMRGLYNEEEDTLELIVEITLDPPAGIVELSKSDAILVNKKIVEVNKMIKEPATVEHFKRMLATMYPINHPLDDECIEGVLHLANQFLVTSVEGKCLEFLMKKSKKPALFKYRMAVNSGFAVLKKYVLLNLEVADFKDKMTMVNAAEIAQLGPDAVEELKARFDKLFP